MPVELDFGTVTELLSAIAGAFREGPGPVVFDCSPLTFIDGGGIGALVWAANAAAADGRELRLSNPGAAMSRLLLLTGVGQRFVVERT